MRHVVGDPRQVFDALALPDFLSKKARVPRRECQDRSELSQSHGA
jgi:hypothetical protein